MKKIKGYTTDSRTGEQKELVCDKIVIELDHDRVLTISRSIIQGNDGIHLGCGIDRNNVAANGRFVIRPGTFNSLDITIEQLK